MNFDLMAELSPALFSDNYTEAREKFLAAAPGSKAYRCSGSGPAGEPLNVDAAYFGEPDARNLLVIVSATHGDEGYCGSAGQLLFLKSGFHRDLPGSTAVLFVHALNAYGFAWDRRVTAEGCDLNRNFIDFSVPPPANLGYEELAEHIVPADISPEAVRRADLAIEEYGDAHGLYNLRVARGSGQYTRPGGASYGGEGPTEARLTLERIVADFDVMSRQKVVIIDYHTGLGPYGYGELQCEQPSGLAGYDRARAIYGPSATSPEVGNSSAVSLNGTQDEYWERILGDRHTYVALEFGTYESALGWRVMREDLWLFKYHPELADAELGRKIRAASKQYSYPQKADWMEMVLGRSHLVHRQALAAFR